jgi:hypothetical protein
VILSPEGINLFLAGLRQKSTPSWPGCAPMRALPT